MAWVAVNKNGGEVIFPKKPTREVKEWSYCETVCIESEEGNIYYEIELPSGTIEALIGRNLTWEDEPVELK